MSIASPEDEPNGYSSFGEWMYVFTDKAIVPPTVEEQPPEQTDEQPDQKS